MLLELSQNLSPSALIESSFNITFRRLIVLHHMFGFDFRMLARTKISRYQSYTTFFRSIFPDETSSMLRCFVRCWEREGDD